MDIHFDEFLVNCQAVFCHFVKNFGKYARKIGNIFQSGHSNIKTNYALRRLNAHYENFIF